MTDKAQREHVQVMGRKMIYAFSDLTTFLADLETELAETKRAVETLQERLRFFENTQEHHKSVLEDLTANGLPENRFDRVEERVRELEENMLTDSDLEDKVADLIDSKVEDAVESALAGREVEFDLRGSITL